jgi:hypothetical protein
MTINQSKPTVFEIVATCCVADKTEKEMNGALFCRDDMVRVERLRGSVLKSAFEGRLV